MVIEFLNLAAGGTGSAPVPSGTATDWSAVFVVAVLLFILLGVVVAILMRGMRRHLIDEPARRSEAAGVDPWAEAGRRLGQNNRDASSGRKPPEAPQSPGDEA